MTYRKPVAAMLTPESEPVREEVEAAATRYERWFLHCENCHRPWLVPRELDRSEGHPDIDVVTRGWVVICATDDGFPLGTLCPDCARIDEPAALPIIASRILDRFEPTNAPQ